MTVLTLSRNEVVSEDDSNSNHFTDRCSALETVLLTLKLLYRRFPFNAWHIAQAVSIKPWSTCPVKPFSESIVWRGYVPMA